MKNNSDFIVVAGGGGYIGSHVVYDLVKAGYKPVIIDNFIRGNYDIAQRLNVDIYKGDIGDEDFIDKIFREINPESVMHFSAFCYVDESVYKPEMYYKNNVASTISLLSMMRKNNIRKFIFSSSCATYGIPKVIPITEKNPQNPINPYGMSKLIVENILKDYAKAYDFNYFIFRYFNAAGANPDFNIGERHNPETHIIPSAILSAMNNEEFSIFGDDYDTKDGTCVRDYIHVLDISQAHILGLKRMLETDENGIYNIGNGNGFSVLDVINTICDVTGLKMKTIIKPRRIGDPPVLVASADALTNNLGWKPEYQSLEKIIDTAWKWHKYDKNF